MTVADSANWYTETKQIQGPNFPEKHSERDTNTLQAFNRACSSSIDLVQDLLHDQDHPLVQLQVEYVKQRLIVISDAYAQWEQDYGYSSCNAHFELVGPKRRPGSKSRGNPALAC
jgi:hypothetical protein